jgi:hypothetical protein
VRAAWLRWIRSASTVAKIRTKAPRSASATTPNKAKTDVRGALRRHLPPPGGEVMPIGAVSGFGAEPMDRA